MIDELRSRFRERFLVVARDRIQTALKHLGADGDAKVVRGELHTLAGEASLIGYGDIATVARDGELAAQEWIEGGDHAAQLQCARVLRQLSRLVAELGADVPATGSDRGAGNNAERRVLIVDDSSIVAGQVSDALGGAGMQVRIASDLASALAAASKFEPDIALIDLTIPGVDPTDLCERLTTVFGARKVKILLMSGLADDELARFARLVGADGHISKLQGLDAVVDTVRAALEGAPA